MTMQELANLAARELPDGWELRLVIGCGFGTVELEDMSGEFEWRDSYDATIDEQWIDAIEYAKHSTGKRKPAKG